MADIRSFFGAGKPKQQSKAASETEAASLDSSAPRESPAGGTSKRRTSAGPGRNRDVDGSVDKNKKRSREVNLASSSSNDKKKRNKKKKKKVIDDESDEDFEVEELKSDAEKQHGNDHDIDGVTFVSETSPSKKQKESEHVVLDDDDEEKEDEEEEVTAKSKKGAEVSSPTPAKLEQRKKRSKAEEKIDPRQPLTKIAFVVTGELHNFSRDDVGDEIKRLGGRVTTSVSGRTSYLVAGYRLEDGRPTNQSSKYKEAEKRGTKIIDEESFVKILEEANAKAENAREISNGAFGSKEKPSSSSSVFDLSKVKKSTSSELWVDRYKPQTSADLIGNGTSIKNLRDWLKNWNARHLHKKLPPQRHNRANPNARAVLLSGPPGVGKTTAATVISKELNFDVIELNASDARSKKIIHALLGDAADNVSMEASFRAASQHKSPLANRVIVMDEVDGMSSDDRGGVQELIKVIKTTSVPIICICNDRQKSSIRSLANHCFDIKFSRPQQDTIARRVVQIAESEGIKADHNAVVALAGSSHGDVRQVIQLVQMWAASSKEINYDKVRERKMEVSKDQEFILNNFNACQFIFNESRNPARFDARYNAFFVDYDLIPLMIQENYPNAVISDGSPSDSLKCLAAAADATTDCDIIMQQIRGRQRWNLLPAAAAMHLRVASVSKGNVGFPGFPSWLGKNSTRGKRKRLLGETAMHMRQKGMMNSLTLRLDYMDTLRGQLLRPLATNNQDEIPEMVRMMDSYGLSRDDVFDTMQELWLPRPGESANPFDKIEAKMKAAFTRKFNKEAHHSQALVHEEGIVGLKAKKRKHTEVVSIDDEGDGEEGGREDQDNDGDEVEELLKMKKGGSNAKKGGKSKKSSSSSSSKKSKGKKRKLEI